MAKFAKDHHGVTPRLGWPALTCLAIPKIIKRISSQNETNAFETKEKAYFLGGLDLIKY